MRESDRLRFANHTVLRESTLASVGPVRLEPDDRSTTRPVALVLRSLGACAAAGLLLGLADLPLAEAERGGTSGHPDVRPGRAGPLSAVRGRRPRPRPRR